MKTCIQFLAALLLAVGVTTASAQQYTISYASTSNNVAVLNGGTNNVALQTTNNYYTATIGVTRYGDVTIQPVFALTGAGTSAVVFDAYVSGDGTNWVADTGKTLSVTAAGTASVTGLTNITMNGIGYLRFGLRNPNATAITNLNLMVITKPRRNG